jgi:acetyl-CoA C-acetyltransferase
MTDAWILSGARTPIGKFWGAFRNLPAPELGAVAIREALSRASLPGDQVDEVIMGNVVSSGVGQAPARQAALKAGVAPAASALTVNKVCGSGLQAVTLAAQAVRLEESRVVVAGGMENMSRAPHFTRGARDGWKLGDVTLKDSLVHDGLWCAFEDCHMGTHAEYTAEKFALTREGLDRYALESQQRASRACAEGAFQDEIVPVALLERGKELLIEADEGPRPQTTLEGLAALKPAFEKTGIVTAGNSSLLSDGAAAVVVTDSRTAQQSPAPWKARIVASYTSGTEPRDLFVAPVAAVRGVLSKAGMEISDVDLFEINEAFASQMLACIQELQIDPERVNVAGGAISLGHPIGASGARVLVTLLSALKRGGLKRGLASLCLGGGNAVAMIVERA